MNMEQIKISQYLFANANLNCYSIVTTPNSDQTLSGVNTNNCYHIFSTDEQNIYLVKLDITDNLAVNVISLCQNPNNKVIFFLTTPGSAMEDISSHLISINTALLSNGETIHFPYYDPEFLSSFISSCEKEEVSSILGPINEIITQKSNKEFISYSKDEFKKIA
jgi:hypothetical protein